MRNLIYHVYPRRPDAGEPCAWRWNVDQLARRIDQFDGVRSVAIATDDTTEDFDTVAEGIRERIGKSICVHIDNNAGLRETHAFPQLVELALRTDPDGMTFFGHAKGVTRVFDFAIRRWIETMHETCLDYPGLIDGVFRSGFLTAGSFKKHGVFGNLGGDRCPWHYAGTHFWFQNSAVAVRDWHAAVQDVPHGVEAWPGVLFDDAESFCLFHVGDRRMCLYRHRHWTRVCDPALVNWRSDFREYHVPPKPGAA